MLGERYNLCIAAFSVKFSHLLVLSLGILGTSTRSRGWLNLCTFSPTKLCFHCDFQVFFCHCYIKSGVWFLLLEQVFEEEIPCSQDFSVITFLSDPMTVIEWNIQGLPADGFSTENGIIVTQGTRWPLMIDPYCQGIKWLKNLAKKLVIYRNKMCVCVCVCVCEYECESERACVYLYLCMYDHGHACRNINKHITPRKCTSKIHCQVKESCATGW